MKSCPNFRWVRIAAVALLAPVLACALYCIRAMQGDTDLPLYDPPNLLDHICWGGAAILVWPAALTAGLGVRADVHPAVVWSLFWSSGLFWAARVEAILIAKNAYERRFHAADTRH